MDRVAHEIVWTFDSDSVRPELVCHAPAEAMCRWEATCECEFFYGMARDHEGPYHLAIEADPDDWSKEVEVKHAMTDGGECHVALFLNEGELVECCGNSGLEFVAGRTLVETTWTGDYYEWRPALHDVSR